MEETTSVTITLAFADATSRNFKFNGVDRTSEAYNLMKSKVMTINANMPAAFASTFVSDSGAQCIMISGLKSVTTQEEVIYSAS